MQRYPHLLCLWQLVPVCVSLVHFSCSRRYWVNISTTSLVTISCCKTSIFPKAVPHGAKPQKRLLG